MIRIENTGANFSQFGSKIHSRSWDTDSFKNANEDWQTIFDRITGTGTQILGTAQNIKDQFTGNKPIDQGDLGGGMGDYTVTSGVNDPQAAKSVSPLIWGMVIVGVVGVTFFIASAAMKKKS